MIFDLVAVVLTIIAGVILYFKWSFRYWERRNVPFLEPTFPFGDMENPFSRKYSIGVLVRKFYEEFKARECKHGGIYNFTSPLYIPIDPEYVKNVMQKDFQHFVDRGGYFNERDEPLSAHLFAIGGQKWRDLRVKLTPTFTSGKMKTMFSTFVKVADQMKTAVDGVYEKGQSIDIKDVMARFSTDIIGSCAFGLECNSFKNPEAEFRKHGRNIFRPLSKLKAILLIFATAKPEIGEFLGIRKLPQESLRFFYNVIKETVTFREANSFSRNDMLQLLIDIKNSKTEIANAHGDGKTLTVTELAAQAFVFFIAGFETSSTTMSFCLFELASNEEMQDRVRNEIHSVLERHEGKVTYDSLKEMTYLTQLVEETLRKYPPLPFLHRRCVQDYKIPNTDTVIEKGTLLFLPVLGLHRDPDLFPDPEKFDPERFSEENRNNIVPFTYLPFGEGPRMCIGLRFGMMQTKLGILTLLKDYKFTVNPKTELPLKINRYTNILTSEGKILLNAERVV